MIKAISNVDSVKGSGQITFDAVTDGSANETVSTSLEGEKFSTRVEGQAKSIHGSISHTKHGQHMVTLRAESSNVASNPMLLNL
jgi:hypothetical protein